MARRHATDDTDPSVSRLAYFGGLAVGISIGIAGYYSVPSLNLGTLGTAMLELAIVAFAYSVTKGIWKLSAWTYKTQMQRATEGNHEGQE